MPSAHDFRRFFGSKATIPSRTLGEITVESVALTEAIDGDLAVFFGHPFECPSPLVRIHSECVFAEVLDSRLCECADQLRLALDLLRAEGSGILFYLRLDGRGAGLSAKVAATALEVAGEDTYDSRIHIGVPPEGRSFDAVGQFLRDRGVRSVRLLTNNPTKVEGLLAQGIEVTRMPLLVKQLTNEAKALLLTKARRFGHQVQIGE